MKRLLASISIVPLLAACGSSPTQYQRFDDSPQGRLAQDRAFCEGYAARESRSAALPPRPSSSSTTTFSGRTSNGTQFEGTARTQSSGGFSSGFQAGMQAREAVDRRAAIFKGCMAELGWKAD
jgi:hypothetical protein